MILKFKDFLLNESLDVLIGIAQLDCYNYKQSGNLFKNFTTYKPVFDSKVLNYFKTLPIFTTLFGKVADENPDKTEGNYILFNAISKRFYFINTEGYEYPRYIIEINDVHQKELFDFFEDKVIPFEKCVKGKYYQ